MRPFQIACEIGVPEAMWLAERVVKSYMQSAGPNYTDKMLSLEALKSSWSQHGGAGDADLIWEFITKIESDLRESLRQQSKPTTAKAAPLAEQADSGLLQSFWPRRFRSKVPVD